MGKKRVKTRKKPGKSRKKHFAECSPEFYFIAIDGSSLKSIRDFADALKHMSDDTFYYHVTDLKNDFASWVKDVFKDAELAEKLVLARTREKHEIALLRHMLKRLIK